LGTPSDVHSALLQEEDEINGGNDGRVRKKYTDKKKKAVKEWQSKEE